jgi:hypothetical protein
VFSWENNKTIKNPYNGNTYKFLAKTIEKSKITGLPSD